MDAKKKKTLWLILGCAALAVLLLIVLALTQSKRSQSESRIVLPAANDGEAAAQADESAQFVEISPENVQTVLSGITRPECYTQTLSVTTEFDGARREQTVTVWKSGSVFHILTEDASGTKHILTDGKTLYLWYAGDKSASKIAVNDAYSLDSLVGIPTYEEILTLPKSRIEQANFVVLPELSDTSCVFISTKDTDCAEYYWVDFASGLLCKQTTLYQDTPVRTVIQTAFTALQQTDAALQTQLALPDGSLPFSIQK